MWRSSYNVNDVQIPLMEIVCLQLSNGKLWIWVLVGKKIIKHYRGFILEEKTFYILQKYGVKIMWMLSSKGEM